MKLRQILWNGDTDGASWSYAACISIQEHPCNDCGAMLDPVRLTVSTGHGSDSKRSVDLRFKTVDEAVAHARKELGLP